VDGGIMINSTFNPANDEAYDKSKISLNWQSVNASVPTGTSVNVDYLLTDDMILDGLQLLAKGSTFGDTVTMQIVCVSGYLANGAQICPPNTVLNQFGTNIGICDDQQTKIDVEAKFPARLQAGLTIRCIYTSNAPAEGTPIDVIANFKLALIVV
jgi:hypothetical protein